MNRVRTLSVVLSLLLLAAALGGGCSSASIETGAPEEDGGGSADVAPDVQPDVQGVPCETDDGCKSAFDDLGACELAVCGANGYCERASAPEHTACDNGDPCTLATECSAGVCGGGLPMACDDGNPCTVDSCVDGACDYAPADGAACDDGDPCTADDACVQDECQGAPSGECPCETDDDCGQFDDDDACNGVLTCGADDQCALDPLTRVVCDRSADGMCDVTVCDPATGTCANGPAEDGTACFDGNHLTLGDQCEAGVCVGEPWEDAAPCATDGECTPYGDDNRCNGELACLDKRCVVAPESVVQCTADLDPCERARCVPATGLCEQYELSDGVFCDDGDACTAAGRCDDGACQTAAVICDDNDPCTADTCDADEGCQFGPRPAEDCDDDDPCTDDSCDSAVEGGCVNTLVEGCTACAVDGDCDDSNPCTTGSCGDDGRCVWTALDDGLACDDGDPCVVEGACDAGVCVGVPNTCDDGRYCTVDSCVEGEGCENVVIPDCQCDTDDDCPSEGCGIGRCTNEGGTPHCVLDDAAAGTLCDDDNPCTVDDACNASGDCVGGGAANCDDGVICTIDTCLPDQGCINNSAGCACVPPDDSPCDDGNMCTTATCQEVDGNYSCVVEMVADGTNCDSQGDGEDCTENHQCQTGACIGQDWTCPETECRDGVDNDFDGDTDCDDTDCGESELCFELDCDDELDSDGDGYTDCADDDCEDEPYCIPEDDCDNGIDDDLDELTDCDDPNCNDDPVCHEQVCNDGIDSDNDNLTDCDDVEDCGDSVYCGAEDCGNDIDDDEDGRVDCDDEECVDNALCLPETNCSDGQDQDQDGLTDCDDPDCDVSPLCVEQSCQDGGDSDGDGLYDCDDPDCANAVACLYCTPVDNLTCGVEWGGSTMDGTIAAAVYPGCTKGQETFVGPEVALSFDSPLDGIATVTVESEFDATVAVLERQCRPGATCAKLVNEVDAGGMEQLEVEVVAGTAYFVVVDGAGPADDGEFTVQVACPELTEDCTNNRDDDLNGLADCADPRCVTHPNCIELECDDEFDNDRDGLVDCDDPDCSAAYQCAQCQARRTLVCGDEVSDTTSGAVNLLDRYPGCTPQIYGAPEHILAFTAPYDMDATFLLDAPGHDAALLVLEGACSAVDACIARSDATIGAGTETLDIALRGGVTYYVVIDGFAAFAAGDYALSLSCSNPPETCDNGVDDDDDGLGDCLDDDCDNQACDDGNACTVGDVCAGNTCVAPFGLDCDDANDCTADTCDADVGCVHTPDRVGLGCGVPHMGVCDTDGVCLQTAVAGDLLFTELMQNPLCAADASGEWFELYNTTDEDLDLYGWTITSANDANPWRIEEHVIVRAYGLAVFCNDGDPTENGGVTCDHVYEGLLFENNAIDNVALTDPVGTTIDMVAWDDGATFPDPEGASMNLDPLFFGFEANDAGAAWCTAPAEFADSTCDMADFGTPGAVNPLCDRTYCEEVGDTTISCGDTISGDTTGLFSAIDGYACTGRVQNGGEQIFRFRPDNQFNVTFRLTTPNGDDLDLNVLRAECAPDDCVAFGDEELTFRAFANTSYYLVVDGYANARGPFELTVECNAESVENCGNLTDDDGDGLVDCDDPDCYEDIFCTEFAEPNGEFLTCDGVVSGTTVGGLNEITTYGCSMWRETGAESTFTFVPEESGEVTFTLSYAAAPFLDLFLMEFLPGDTQCVDYDDTSVTYNVTAGQTYYVAVDGRAGAVGDFVLATDCASEPAVEIECDDDQDNDGDGRVDCRDTDCRYHPHCMERTCDDDLDNDRDGLYDCADPDCALDTACDACIDAEPIGCGETLSSSNLGLENRLDHYACEPTWNESGGERIFAFTPPGNGPATATLSALAGDFDVFVLAGACQTSACRGAGTTAAEFNMVFGETYYIVVDGFGGSEGTFDLTLDCGDYVVPELCTDDVDNDEDGLVDCDDPDCEGQVGCAETDCSDGLDDEGDGLVDCDDPDCVTDRDCNACAEAVEIICGDTIIGTNEGEPDRLNGYGCIDYDLSGGETVYRFHAESSLAVNVGLASFSDDIDLVILEDACGPGACRAQGVQGTWFSADAGHDYYIVVDGFGGGGSPYQLAVTCEGVAETCGDGRDNDGNGLTDCEDPACQPYPGCPELCDDMIDNDGDGQADCDDADCNIDPACAELCTRDRIISCGETVSGTNEGQDNEINDWYGCASITETGGEVAHELVLDGDYDVTIQLTSALELDVFVTAETCSDSLCIGWGGATDTMTFSGATGDTFYVVVDGFQGAAGDYDLEVVCAPTAVELCDVVGDEDGDGQADCDDSDCAGTTLCLPEGDCNDGTDDDDDGLADCDDPGCAAAALCGVEVDCDNGVDDDNDTLVDCDDPGCAMDLACQGPQEDCTNGVDDDGDNAIDCADLDCAEVLSCREDCTPTVIGGCDLTYAASTVGAASQITYHPLCIDWDESGGDFIYELTVDSDVTLNASIDILDAVDLDLFVHEAACGTSNCLASGDDSVTVSLTAGVPYYIIVDGYEGDAGDFNLTLDCGADDVGCFTAADCVRAECATAPVCVPEAACEDGVDNDLDGDVDCADDDCAADPGCLAAEICTDGVDNDGDGAVDCLDLDAGLNGCFAHPACDVACPAPVALTCDSVTDDDTTGDTNVLNWYPLCDGATVYGGPEIVYSYVSDTARLIRPRLVTDVPGLTLVTLNDPCSTYSCTDIDPTPGTIEVAADRPVYFAVDGATGVEGEFTLYLQCDLDSEVFCGDGADDDDDTLVDCDDPDCVDDDACAIAEDCAVAGDEDGDGAADCADEDCWADAACTCTAAATLTCGGSVSGDTTGGTNQFSGYDCDPGTPETGPEAVYSFTADQDQTVTFAFDVATSTVFDIYVLENTCNAPYCIAFDADPAPENQVTIAARAGVTYYVVVDGWAGAEGAFTLNTTCEALLQETNCADGLDDDADDLVDCADPDCALELACANVCRDNAVDTLGGVQQLVCGNPVNGTNIGGSAFEYSSYSCQADYNEAGPETYYAFIPSADYGIDVVFATDGADLDVFLLNQTCDADACLAFGGYDFPGDRVLTTVEAGKLYYLVVDGYGGETGDFEIMVDCNPL